MHPLRRRKLYTLLSVLAVLGVVLALVLYALRQNISLFYTPTEVAEGIAPKNHTIRLGGMVVLGSIVHDKDLSVRFEVTDYHKTVAVVYNGVLPDLFNEGTGVVAQGQWTFENQFKASTVLAKHDENYMPPEVKQALAKYPKNGRGA